MSDFAHLALLWIALSTATVAQQTAAPGFGARIAGDWRGAGEVRGMTADMTMRWEPVLDGQFLKLSMENLMSAQDGKTWHFKAQAFYRIGADGAVAGTWFDSRGISLPLAGRVDGDLMAIDWGTESSPERGRSSYRLSADALEVTDEVYSREGVLTVFGRTRLTRP